MSTKVATVVNGLLIYYLLKGLVEKIEGDLPEELSKLCSHIRKLLSQLKPMLKQVLWAWRIVLVSGRSLEMVGNPQSRSRGDSYATWEGYLGSVSLGLVGLTGIVGSIVMSLARVLLNTSVM